MLEEFTVEITESFFGNGKDKLHSMLTKNGIAVIGQETYRIKLNGQIKARKVLICYGNPRCLRKKYIRVKLADPNTQKTSFMYTKNLRS